MVNNVGSAGNSQAIAKAGEVKLGAQATIGGTAALDALDAHVANIPNKSAGGALSNQIIEASK